jgi:UPF0716 protein FxsA
MGYLIAIFVGIPLIELALLIKLGSYLGVFNTLLIVVGTGVLGAYLAKMQGLMILRDLQYEVNQGRMPMDHIFDGIIILCSGIVLLTPGVLTDICGFLGLFPVTRKMFKEWMKKKIQAVVNRGDTITVINMK